MGPAQTRMYRKGVLEAEGFPVADVSEHLEEPDTIVWVDFCRPGKEQLNELAGELGLHELAVEEPSNLISGRSSTITPPTSSCRATPCASTWRRLVSTRPR